MATYAFGDTDLAGRRLGLLAEWFEPPSRALLEEVMDALGHRPPRLAVDMGCGPGHTTRLVADVTCATTVGLDFSASYVETARANYPDLTFECHDATVVPFPAEARPPDLIFARYLVSHLPEPEAAVAGWLTELSPGGCVAIDENETIEADHEVLKAYERAVVAVVGARGASLHAGPRMAAAPLPDGVTTVLSAVRPFDVPAHRAATLFAMNLAVWRTDPAAAGLVDDDLAAGLDELARSGDTAPVHWQMRQLILRRD